MMAPLTRILVADDHPVVRSGLVAILDQPAEFSVVAEAADGVEAVELFARLAPDVCVLDLRMPRLSGLEATERIRRLDPQAKIVVLSSFDGDEDIYRALKAGARSYLLKDTPEPELIAAVRAVAAGLRRIPPAVAERLAARLDAGELTGRELEILERIVRGEANKQIGAALGITEGTVKSHVNHLLAKLGVGDRTEAAVAALRRGLVRPGSS
ncbi:MAG TPA: response regulator transcription factor [Thermoanaerobaculia bacterium]|nr:response regulator transcription factor [Thermoanaerobaculia bacterium]